MHLISQQRLSPMARSRSQQRAQEPVTAHASPGIRLLVTIISVGIGQRYAKHRRPATAQTGRAAARLNHRLLTLPWAAGGQQRSTSRMGMPGRTAVGGMSGRPRRSEQCPHRGERY
jgi:hypothetical protein